MLAAAALIAILIYYGIAAYIYIGFMTTIALLFCTWLIKTWLDEKGVKRK